MRKRVAQLEKDTSGNETNQEIIAELQALIQKRSRKPRTINMTVSTEKNEKTTDNNAPTPVAKSAEPVKQVDINVAPAHVVDAVLPAPHPEVVLPTVRQQLPPSSQLPSSSQKPTQVLKKAPIEKVITLFNDASVFNPKDLSHFTEKDLENVIHGPKMSIDDVQSSSEDEEQEEQEELVSDEDEEPKTKRLSQNTGQINYRSSSDDDKDPDSDIGSDSKSVSPSPRHSIEMDIQPNGMGTHSEDPLLSSGSKLSFKEMNTRGSSQELDRSANNAVDDALASDLSPFHMALRGHRTGPDSDTVVASQGEEFAGSSLTKKTGYLISDAPSLDPIEPSELPESGHKEADQPEPIASDDDGPAFQSTPKPELVIRTRRQRNKVNADKSDDLEEVPATQEDTQIVEERKSSRLTRSMKRITTLPIPPNPSVRDIKAGRTRTTMPGVQNKGEGNVEDEDEESEPLMETTKFAKPMSKVAAKNTTKLASKTTTPKGNKSSKQTTARATRSQATVTPKPKRSVKITPLEPIPDDAVGKKTISEVVDESIVASPPWAVLPEKGSSQNAMVNGFSRDPLFLPSETQDSFSYSQHPSVILGSQRSDGTQKPSPHDSEDEEEVLASVTKVKTRYRSLSQIASSQSFSTPRFQSRNAKVPDLDLYGNKSRVEESEDTGSDSMSGSDDKISHIPASRRAGLQKK